MRCYAVRGNMANVALVASLEHADLPKEHYAYFLPEVNATGCGKRDFPKVQPPWWKFRAEPDEDKRYKFRFDDAITSTGGFRGIDNYVSESAVKALAPHLGDECEFVLAPIGGVPEPYYGMWVRNYIDAIDFAKAGAKPVEYLKKNGRNPLRLMNYEFDEVQVKDRFLFRLAGYDIDDTSLHDYATDNFLELVRQLRITGFHFYKKKLDFNAITPVKPRR